MNDWQWFEEYEQAALERGDHERAALRQIHRDAYECCETDPDRTLELFREGRRQAAALEEPWWVLLFEHWQVHITLYEKCDYRHVLAPAVRNALELRKPQHRGFPQAAWILGDLIEIYVQLDPLSYADEIAMALADLESQLTTQAPNARYLFWFHQLDAAFTQVRSDDALQIALRIRDAAQADEHSSTGDHYLVPCYRFLCCHFGNRQDWSSLATWADAGEELSRKLGEKESLAAFLMWQAVLHQQRGEHEEASRLYDSATARKRRLKTAHHSHYYDAMCAFHELRGDLKKSQQLHERQIQDCIARGQNHGEWSSRLEQLRLLAKMGQPLEPYLSDAQRMACKFRRPDCYLPKLDEIARGASQ